MDNHGMDDHDLDIKRLDDPKWKLLLENPKVRILGALAIGLVLGSGATWGMLRTDQPKTSRATIMEQRKADPKIKAQSNGSARSVKQTTVSKKSKAPVKVAKKDTKKKPVTSASAKKKSTKKTATASKAKPATKTTTTAKSTKKKKRSTTAKPANASTKPTSKPATSTSNTSSVKPPVVDSKSAQPVTTARIHTMVPE